MSKRSSYSLKAIKALIKCGNYYITNSSLQGAFKIGLNEDDILSVVLDLNYSNMYKTMRSRTMSGLWQDVYHIRYKDYLLYIKLQISDSAIIISFKEK
ncbi:MAG: type II toxin-antitoxin system MqsR family toxin [Spirochaetia bacterium]|nr:type II toxin-antitoxin system MqsR family toxin [Spirochaetia bacterium]